MIDIQIDVPALERLMALYGEAPALVQKEARRAMEASVLIAEAEVAKATPVRTGRLRKSISSHVTEAPGEVTGTVEIANVPYALFVEEDTRPHVIEAKPGKALAFQQQAGSRISYGTSYQRESIVTGGTEFTVRRTSRRIQALFRVQRGRGAGRLVTRRSGRTMIFVSRVNHPGTKGQHMISQGAAAAEPAIRAQFERALARVTQKLARERELAELRAMR